MRIKSQETRFLFYGKMKLTQSGDLGAAGKSRNFQKKLNTIKTVSAAVAVVLYEKKKNMHRSKHF